MRRALPELLPLFTPEGHHHDGCATAHSPRQAGGAGGVEATRDRGGGKRSPSPQAASPNGTEPPRSSAWGDPGDEPDTGLPLPAVQEMTSNVAPGHGCSPDIASTDPAPSWGRGRSAAGAGGVGAAERRMGSLPAGGAGKGCRREVRWLECGRQGRGNEFPLPVGPSPRGDISTVQHMGRSRRRTWHGCPPAPTRIRLLP